MAAENQEAVLALLADAKRPRPVLVEPSQKELTATFKDLRGMFLTPQRDG